MRVKTKWVAIRKLQKILPEKNTKDRKTTKKWSPKRLDYLKWQKV